MPVQLAAQAAPWTAPVFQSVSGGSNQADTTDQGGDARKRS